MESRCFSRRAAAGGFVLLFLLFAGLLAGTARADVFDDVDARSGSVAPTSGQLAAVQALGAHASWNQFGSPKFLVRYGGYLAQGVAGSSPAAAARAWIDANKALFGLSSTANLHLVRTTRLTGSDGWAVHFRQRFGGLDSAEGGLITIGLEGAPGSWQVASAGSSLTGQRSLAASPTLSPVQAWIRAAANVGRHYTAAQAGPTRQSAGWTAFSVDGLTRLQRAKLVAVPTPSQGVRPAYDTLFVDVQGGTATAYEHLIDAADGRVLVRKNIVDQSHPLAAPFNGTVPATDAACAPKNGPWVVAPGESVGTVVVGVEAVLAANDSVIRLYRDGAVVASQDTLTSPEALVYDPSDGGEGTYEVEVCDFPDATPWDSPRDYVGQIVFNPADAGVPYPPMWKVFPAFPKIGAQTTPWNYPSDDIRQLWCWESTVGFPPQPVFGPGGEGCDREVQNLASRAPWDFDVRADVPTFTTKGNNANTAEAWASPLTPGPLAFRPFNLDRQYVFPWNNTWHTQKCNPATLVPSMEPDLPAAVTNLFVMHNRMHDWSYFLGFTERHWNAQDSNFGAGGTMDRDPVSGDTQAGGLTGGAPSYLGRDNANMIPLPDGVPPITNMYLWQPLAGAFYAPCVDGDFDQAVIGHEYGHLIENRMIGKGGTRSGHHAGAMGESFGDFDAVEYLNEYNFVPVSGANPFAVGAYVTGNKLRAIRNYGMNFARVGGFPSPGSVPLVNPLNLSDIGYDLTGSQVHADGEIWSAVNYDIRQALVDKYNASFPASNTTLQRQCGDGQRPVTQCPGNRRWIQIVYDAMLLMPVDPSMLDARDAYLAADQMRFGGANQAELWLAFARRGFGQAAFSTNDVSDDNDVDPRPDFQSPVHGEATVTFRARATDEGNAPITSARFYVGHFEARVSPIADTDPATNAPATTPATTNNLDAVARFVPGKYEFVVNAPGHGHKRFRLELSAGQNRTVSIGMATNWASRSKGAVASGDGTNFNDLIDDTESTNWECAPTSTPCPANQAQGSQVTVDLGGGTHTLRSVKVSAMLRPGQNRFTALRQFQIQTCVASTTNGDCTLPTGFVTRLTSQANAFPGFNPRPVSPELLLRSFALPSAVQATHVRVIVLNNQCTGNPKFQGDQDNDPANNSDCTTGSPGQVVPPFEAPIPQVLDDRDDEVRIAELQVFGTAFDTGTPPTPGDPVVVLTKSGPLTATRGSTVTYRLSYRNLGPEAAQGVKVVDSLPAGLGFVSALAGGSYDAAARTVTWNLGTVNAGSTGSVSFTATISPSSQIGSVLVNEGSLTAANTVSPPTATATTLILK
jgi:extracellular elastinolytic metalloproteinase